MRFARSAGATLLVLAACAVCAHAEPLEDDPLPARIPPGLELGAGGGLLVAFPEVTALVSVPVGPYVSLEAIGGWMPRLVYEVEHGQMQAQLRVPFRGHLRSRRSLVAGVTRISTRRRSRFDNGFWGNQTTVIFPHAGVSLQWPLGPQVDLRFDAQGLFTLDGEFPLVPRGVATFVWRTRRTR